MNGPDFDMFDDPDDDDLMSLGRIPPADLVIKVPHHGVLQASLFEGPDIASAIGTVAPKIEQRVGLAKPPRIWWALAMRLVMSTKRFRAEFEPLIAEMYDEYYECIARGDERAAWFVVLRCNIAVVPGWVWGHVWCLAWRLVDWLMGR